MKRRTLMAVISAIISVLLVSSGIIVYRSFKLVPEMFRLNSTLKSEGYYTGEFEWKMLGIAYCLDKGQFMTALLKLNQLHNQLQSRTGLIKVPKFSDKKAELEFYLNLQNPRTGAFMDDSYPYFTYIAPTLNVLEHTELLAKEINEPLQLKYPLKFLDQIDTPEKLTTYLDDLSTVGKLVSQYKAPYLGGAAELVYYQDIERNYLYHFSMEWKEALLKWFYDHQDNTTGYWGPKLRGSGQLLKSGDTGSTFRIIKLFVDDKGKNVHPEFPLRFKDELFATTLRKLSEPMPDDADLDELHDWSITRSQGIDLLTNIWSGASAENKSGATKLMEEIVRNRFERFYVQNQGGFSLYPGVGKADLDGTGTAMDLLNKVGALSFERQRLLWGSPNENIVDIGARQIFELKESDVSSINNAQGINSIRLYRTEPVSNNYESNVVSIIYPKDTPILDIMDLQQKLAQYVSTESQTYGMWVSKEMITQELETVKATPVPVSVGNIPLKAGNEALMEYRQLIVIGFDVFQVPKYKLTLRIR